RRSGFGPRPEIRAAARRQSEFPGWQASLFGLAINLFLKRAGGALHGISGAPAGGERNPHMNLHFAIFVVAASGFAAPATAADIKAIASPGVREAYNELVPQFEKASGHHVITIWDGVQNVAKRVAEGETADIVILPLAQIEELTRKGKLV